MSLWNIAKRISGIAVPKPYIYTNQKALCGTAENTSDGTEQCHDDDVPVPDMENPFQKDRRQCILCKFNITANYKNPKLLSQFVSMYTGKVYGRHITGLCKKRQEQVEVEILKSQNAEPPDQKSFLECQLVMLRITGPRSMPKRIKPS